MFDHDAVSWLWAFCTAKHTEVKDKAAALQRVACAAIRLEFSKHDINPAELLEEGHVFTRHFKPAGLEMLAVAADHVRLSRPGSASGVGQDRSTRDTQSQPRLDARSKVTNTGHVQTSGSCEAAPVPTAMYEQATHSSWGTNSVGNWPQHVAVHYMPHGVQGLHQPSHSHNSMPTSAPISTAQYLPIVDLQGRQDTMTSNIPLYSGVNQSDQSVTPNGPYTTQDWNEAMQDTLAQFEDGSTDDWEKAAQEAIAQFGDDYQMS
jgi:hypothetical protein